VSTPQMQELSPRDQPQPRPVSAHQFRNSGHAEAVNSLFVRSRAGHIPYVATGQPELGNVPVRTRSAATSRSLVLDLWDA
jgi:hypothetical protein